MGQLNTKCRLINHCIRIKRNDYDVSFLDKMLSMHILEAYVVDYIVALA